jgi:hypothetical protein
MRKPANEEVLLSYEPLLTNATAVKGIPHPVGCNPLPTTTNFINIKVNSSERCSVPSDHLVMIVKEHFSFRETAVNCKDVVSEPAVSHLQISLKSPIYHGVIADADRTRNHQTRFAANLA